MSETRAKISAEITPVSCSWLTSHVDADKFYFDKSLCMTHRIRLAPIFIVSYARYILPVFAGREHMSELIRLP